MSEDYADAQHLDAAQDFDAAQDLLSLSNEFHPGTLRLASPKVNIPSPQPIQGVMHETIMGTPQNLPPPRNHMDPDFGVSGEIVMQDADQSLMFMQDSAPIFNEESPGEISLPDFLRYMPPLDNSLSGPATPRGIFDFNFNWDLDFSGFEFGVFDQTLPPQEHAQEEPQASGPSNAVQYQQQNSHQKPPHEVSVAVRAEAFNQSVWRYVPRGRTNPALAEESNLALPDGESESQSPSQVPARTIIKERLTYTTRDKLLAVVLDASSPQNSKRIAAGFPSLELLDGLIQIFFTNVSINALPWLHLPTFSPAEVHPLFLACIIGTGAFYCPEILLQNLGLALLEAARKGLANSIEQDNTLIRDLQYLQVSITQ